MYCFKKFHPKVRNHGEGPSRGLVRDCTTSPINLFAALVKILFLGQGKMKMFSTERSIVNTDTGESVAAALYCCE